MNKMQYSLKKFRNQLSEIRNSIITKSYMFLLCQVKNEQNSILGKSVIDFRAHLREREKE